HHLGRLAAAAQIVLAAASIVCISVLIYFLYYYAFTRQRQFSSWAGVLVYYVFPAVLAVLFLAALLARDHTKIRLALLVCSITASIYSLEIFLSMWSSLPSVMEAQTREAIAKTARGSGVKADYRTRREVIDDLLRQGSDAVPSVFAGALYKRQNDDTIKSQIDV